MRFFFPQPRDLAGRGTNLAGPRESNSGPAGRGGAGLLHSGFAQDPLDVLYFDPINFRNLGNLHSVPQPSTDARDMRCRNIAVRGVLISVTGGRDCGPSLAGYGRLIRNIGRRGGPRRHRKPPFGGRAGGQNWRVIRSRLGSKQRLGRLAGPIDPFPIIRELVARPGSVISGAVGRTIFSHSSKQTITHRGSARAPNFRSFSVFCNTLVGTTQHR